MDISFDLAIIAAVKESRNFAVAHPWLDLKLTHAVFALVECHRGQHVIVLWHDLQEPSMVHQSYISVGTAFDNPQLDVIIGKFHTSHQLVIRLAFVNKYVSIIAAQKIHMDITISTLVQEITSTEIDGIGHWPSSSAIPFFQTFKCLQELILRLITNRYIYP